MTGLAIGGHSFVIHRDVSAETHSSYDHEAVTPFQLIDLPAAAESQVPGLHWSSGRVSTGETCRRTPLGLALRSACFCSSSTGSEGLLPRVPHDLQPVLGVAAVAMNGVVLARSSRSGSSSRTCGGR